METQERLRRIDPARLTAFQAELLRKALAAMGDPASFSATQKEQYEALRRELPQETAERRQEYSAACLNLGRRVRVLRPDGERSALAVSLTPDYGLAVRYDDGTEEVLRSGEVSVRGLYGYTDKE